MTLLTRNLKISSLFFWKFYRLIKTLLSQKYSSDEIISSSGCEKKINLNFVLLTNSMSTSFRLSNCAGIEFQLTKYNSRCCCECTSPAPFAATIDKPMPFEFLWSLVVCTSDWGIFDDMTLGERPYQTKINSKVLKIYSKLLTLHV